MPHQLTFDVTGETEILLSFVQSLRPDIPKQAASKHLYFNSHVALQKLKFRGAHRTTFLLFTLGLKCELLISGKISWLIRIWCNPPWNRGSNSSFPKICPDCGANFLPLSLTLSHSFSLTLARKRTHTLFLLLRLIYNCCLVSFGIQFNTSIMLSFSCVYSAQYVELFEPLPASYFHGQLKDRLGHLT